MKKIRKAVLPVAGFGTRVLPATKSIPKEMLPVVDRPALQYVVDEAIEAGIEHIVFVTGRNKGAIEDYFDRAYELESILYWKKKKALLAELEGKLPSPGSTSFVRQQSPQGLGHAVWCARDVIGDEPFAVLLPDVLIKGEPGCLKQMIAAYHKTGGNIIAVNEVPMDETDKYGVIAPKSQDGNIYEMSGMVEKPKPSEAPSNLSITGRYILQPQIFDWLEAQKPGAGNEIQLTDAMAKLMNTDPFFALAFRGEPHDCGSKLGYFKAVMAYAVDHKDIGDAARALITDMCNSSEYN
ncbi:MAG TPA: UTP--glucose-1-phosphate uridylyltransferase GalU [Hellea balneolensis]|uniref:UTP--glucose-1-phosphate uridylyltransferase n=1 Tax=Hellea balneolensis TaxID=287478 RepID=A0A7C5LTV9_9PROT|nr:UTP--glucose-1-phosphate uridylyltransferase GalU [Hellea balneolensis]